MQRRLVDEGSRQEKEEVERLARGFSGSHLARGNLTSTPFPEVLAQLSRWKSGGALLLRRDKVKKIIYVNQGYPSSIKSNLLSECLGQVMVRERMISQADCDLSIRRMQETKRQQGTLLIEMGIISPHNLHYALQLQLEAKLYDVFGWTQGDYQFNPKAEQPQSTVQLEHTPVMLILEGVRRMWTPERVKAALTRHLPLVVGPHPDPLQRLQDLDLNPAEGALAASLDGTRTLQEVLDKAGWTFGAMAACYAMLAAQVVETRPPGSRPGVGPPPLHTNTRPEDAATRAVSVPVFNPPPLKRSPSQTALPAAAAAAAPAAGPPPLRSESRLPVPSLTPPPVPARSKSQTAVPTVSASAPPPAANPPKSGGGDRERVEFLSRRVREMRKQNYFEMLGISKNAGADEVRKAYFSQAKDFHPDKHFGTSAEIKTLADQIYSMLSTAYETLADSRDREDYVKGLHTGVKSGVSDEVGRILQAENRFQKGEGFMKKKDWARAHQAFKEAVDLYPDEGEFHSYLGWALYQTNPQDQGVVAKAQAHLEEGLRLNARHDKGYLFLGWLHKAVGRRAEAEAEFEKAIQCNPDCAEALRELRLLSEQRELSGKGGSRRG